MASLFSTLFLAIGWKWFLIEALVFAFALVCASFIDWDQMILPDSFTLSGIFIGLLGAWLNPERAFIDAFLGVLFGGGSLLSYQLYVLFTSWAGGHGRGRYKNAGLDWCCCVLESLMFLLF